LHKYIPDTNGRPFGTERKAEDVNKLTDDDLDELKKIPGVWEAYHGASKMVLKVCTIIGKKACISREVIAEFQNAPLSIKHQLECLEKDHVKNWEDLLEPVLQSGDEGVLKDPREATADPEAPPPGPELPPIQLDLTKFESEQELKQKVKIGTKLKCNSDKYLWLLEDSEGAFMYSVQNRTIWSRREQNLVE
jgi:hypothetical protein